MSNHGIAARVYNTLMNVGLPKWSALTVVGERITEEQAMEVLVRTHRSQFFTNDKQWLAQVLKALGVHYSAVGKYPGYSYEALAAVLNELGVLDLRYLSNDRVMSAWIGGPRGWCDWTGAVGCGTYNIGKWPSIDAVHQEWTRIAEAFPFLELTTQLWNGAVMDLEQGSIEPVIEFQVHRGTVEMRLPTTPIVPGVAGSTKYFGGERGCSLELWKRAVAHVRRLRGPV